MTYVPDPTDATRPILSDPAASAAEEFRGIKALIATIAGNPNTANIWRKNLVINGGMQVDQRNEGAVVVLAATGKYITDKWFVNRDSTSTAAAQQVTPPFALSGKALLYATTVAGAPAAGDTALLRTAVEGLDCAFLEWGGANAAAVSLSFQVKSPLAGIHTFALKNSAQNRVYVGTYLVDVANVAQSITVNNIPGDAAGVWLATNGIGVELDFDMGSGVNSETGTVNAWQAGNFSRTAAAVKVNNTVGPFYITNVQLEQATAASPFEQRKFVENLLLCQRYYCKTFPQGTAPAVNLGSAGAILYQQINPANIPNGEQAQFTYKFAVPMRAVPTILPYTPLLAIPPATNMTRCYDITAGQVNSVAALNTSYDLSTERVTLICGLVAGGFGFSAAGDYNSAHLSAEADFF